MRPRIILRAALLVGFSSNGASVCLAQDAAAVDSEKRDVAEQAAELFWQANDSYTNGEFLRAIELYRSAFELSGEAALVFNIGQCHRQLRDCDAARAAYSEYRRFESEPPEAALIWAVELDAECPGPDASNAWSVRLSPAWVSATTGVLPSAGANASALGVDASAPESVEAAGSERVLAWSLLGVAAAAAATSGYFAVRATSTLNESENRAESLRDTGELWSDADAEKEANGETQRNLAIGFGIGAVAAAGAGAALLWVGQSAKDEPPSVGLTLDATQAGVVWGGAF